MNNFNTNFNRSRKRFNIMFGIVTTFIGAVFVGIVCWWGFVAYVAFGAVDQIEQDGVSGVLGQVWCGNNSDCQKNLDSRIFGN